MALEVTVGPPQLVVHNGETVWASEPDGRVARETPLGLIFRDTRIVSTWTLTANGAQWELLNSGAVAHFAARVFLTNPSFNTIDGEVAPRTLSLVLGRWADGGVHEDLDLTNHGRKPVHFNLELTLRSDFADLFELKMRQLVRRGRTTTDWLEAGQRLRTTYVNQDFRRGVEVEARADTAAVYANGRLSFDIALAPGAHWHACLLYTIVDDGERIPPPIGCVDTAGRSPAAARVEAWRHNTLKLSSSNEELYRTYSQAVDDIAALRLPLGGGVVPAAGLPWFLALFGRDSLIVSMQALPVTHEFARGALTLLGERQATQIDEFRDAEPGKILHEMRVGELAHFGLVPHSPYYGTADATPLYLVLLHQTWRWTGDRGLIERHRTTAEACLTWIDTYGDRDGDGFQEYATRSPKGYENMGWKDAGDAVLHADGSMVANPKALCELQGYVFAAWTGMAEIYDAIGEADRAATLRRRAATLYNRFNDEFWDEELGFYLYALDGAKRPVRTIASNVGHCLWSGIVRPDRARRVVERLMAPDMFSGWGIRTLSADHPAFNPYSYHNGSVWPHDNGLIAQGMKRYGFARQAAQVARALSGAASFFALHQVPELFAGIQKNGTDFPIQCLGANVPQAWAAGSVFSFLQALLGMEADAPAGVLRLNPELPTWLPDVTLRDLKVGKMLFDLRFVRTGGHTEVEVLRGPDAGVVVESG